MLGYIAKLEHECKKMKINLNKMERIESATKTDLSTVSTQALQVTWIRM